MWLSKDRTNQNQKRGKELREGHTAIIPEGLGVKVRGLPQSSGNIHRDAFRGTVKLRHTLGYTARIF